MASSNAETDVTNANASNEQQVMSPVPDLVTNVPSTTNEAHMPTVVFPSTSNSPASTDTSHAPVIPQPSPSVKHTATATTKTIQPSPAPPRATSAPSAASEASVKNRLSREDKFRKKDDKSVDHVLRALNSLNTAEEKLAAMCKKYADMFDEHRKLQLINKQTEKKCCLQQREKEQLQAEHSKAILTRSRLENLCRELQRQNKAIKDESLLKIREEEEKRKEVSAKFQTTMNEITTLMQQNNDKNMKLRDDNIDMTTKLKNICEQYELRQQQVERISKQMQLEQQLADAKLSKLKMEMAAEREMLLQEKKQLLMELQQYQQRCTEFQATEVNLRNQISMYNDKYDEFQKALARSNDVFGGFKGEMEKMSKKICKLEKETSSWKQRWERSHNALLEMGAEKQKSEQELAVVSRQLATLQGLCRTLQTERSSMLAKLKIFQAGGHEPLEKSTGNLTEKCHKQSEQSVNHRDQPCNHIAESNKVLDLYAQDIMASFQATENTPAVNSAAVTTESASTAIEASVPSAASPLPDVVGATNMCVFGQNADVNSALCERLENVTLEPSPPVLVENSNVTNNVQPSNAAESSLLTLEENLSVDQNVEVISNQQSVIVENLTQVVLNGDAHTNGSPPADLTPEELKSQPLKSPVAKSCLAKSGDSGKKTKESIKKKKK